MAFLAPFHRERCQSFERPVRRPATRRRDAPNRALGMRTAKDGKVCVLGGVSHNKKVNTVIPIERNKVGIL